MGLNKPNVLQGRFDKYSKNNWVLDVNFFQNWLLLVRAKSN